MTIVLSGDWAVERGISSCTVSQPFDVVPSHVGFKTVPNTDRVELLIAEPSSNRRSKTGAAAVTLSGSLAAESADYFSVSANGVRVTTISLPRVTLDALAKGQSITIKTDKSNTAIHLTEFDVALAKIAQCESDLLASWGFGKSEQESVSIPLKGSLRGLIKTSDYPPDLLRKGIGGIVGFRMRIDADGSVGECAVLESSGNKLLDQHTCSIIKQRARFTPAIRHDGTPMRSFTYGKISWGWVGR